MTAHEQAMARARDYVRAHAEPPTAAVERRERYDVVAHLLRLQKSCDLERAALARERERSAATRSAIVRFGRRTNLILIGFVLTLTAMTGLAAYFIQRNREAIEVGCLVVVQVVRDSGANSGKPRTTPEGRAQARITGAFYAELLKGMTPERRAAVLHDQAIVRAAGGAIPEPQCEQIADDPARVRRETLQEAKR